MKQDIKKYEHGVYQIDVFMENKPGRMSCYYIESSNPILVEVGPSNSFTYLISSLNHMVFKHLYHMTNASTVIKV